MPIDNIIYFDNASTTKVDPEVLAIYNKVTEETFANASSIHFEGQKASRLLDKSRELILSTLGLSNSHQVIFTSGATEANNLAIKGFALKYKNRGNHLITTAIEHASVLETFRQLEKEFGFTVTYLPVDHNGKISLDELKAAITDKTILVSVMAVNNEIGVINDIESIGKILESYPKIAFHVDATQAIGKINLNYKLVDFISFSGHKIHGLKGTGALIKRKNIELLPVLSGGGQEDNFRSGTNDVAGAVSLAKAVQLSYNNFSQNMRIVTGISEQIYYYLEENSDLYEINSSKENPYIINFSLKNKKASVVVEGLSNENIMVSSISACHSKKEAYSHVVEAMNKGDILSHNTIRVSLDYYNDIKEAVTFLHALDKLVRGIKQ